MTLYIVLAAGFILAAIAVWVVVGMTGNRKWIVIGEEESRNERHYPRR